MTESELLDMLEATIIDCENRSVIAPNGVTSLMKAVTDFVVLDVTLGVSMSTVSLYDDTFD